MNFPFLVYYKTDEHFQQRNENGELTFYQVNSALLDEKVYLMHPDNLIAFLDACEQNKITALQYGNRQDEGGEG